MTIGKLSGQCDFGQKGQSYCNQRGQSCVAKRVKVAWLFHASVLWAKLPVTEAFQATQNPVSQSISTVTTERRITEHSSVCYFLLPLRYHSENRLTIW